jgi:transaldolase
LIFTLERYQEVIDSYLSGLEACTKPLDSVHCVASFFISRIDSEIDTRLETIGSEEALGYRGKAAVAQGQLAYEIFNKNFSNSSQRWLNLFSKGAHQQRPLWASTSTKNHSYDPLLYIKDLIAADTVSTIPDATIVLIEDTQGSISGDGITPETINDSRQLLSEVSSVGVNLSDVGRVLEEQGLEKFQTSFKTMLEALGSKMSQ